MSQEAHAGCLSFELSHRSCSRIVVNCGLPATSRETWRQVRARDRRAFDRDVQRHIVVPLPRNRLVQAPAGRRADRRRPAPTSRSRARSAATRSCCARRTTAMPTASASMHQRASDARGRRHARSTARTCSVRRRRRASAAAGRDQFAVRFHLHPSVKANRLTDGHGVMLLLPNNEVWTFNAYEERVELEESVYLAGTDGPRRTVQMVIYGHARSVPRVHWSFQQADPAAVEAAAPRARRATRAHVVSCRRPIAVRHADAADRVCTAGISGCPAIGMPNERQRRHDRRSAPHHPRSHFRVRQDRAGRVRPRVSPATASSSSPPAAPPRR